MANNRLGAWRRSPEYFDRVIRAYGRKLAEDPRSFLFIPLANTCTQAGKFKLANEIINRGLAFHPHMNAAILAKGRLLLAQSRYADAEKMISIVVKRDPENILAKKMMAKVCYRLGKIEEGLEYLESVRLLAPRKNIEQNLYESLVSRYSEVKNEVKAAAEPAMMEPGPVGDSEKKKTIDKLEKWLDNATRMMVED